VEGHQASSAEEEGEEEMNYEREEDREGLS
jgi:hypothetical protein